MALAAMRHIFTVRVGHIFWGFCGIIVIVIIARQGDTQTQWTNVNSGIGGRAKASEKQDSNHLHINKFNACTKGDALVEREFMIAELPHFIKVYSKRPGENEHGTKLSHQFAMWCAVRKLKPRHIIESGILRGYGSWMLRQAAPDAQLILLDPNARQQYVDKHFDTLYLTGKRFKDFADVDWASLNIDVTRSLVYFDDHQSAVFRSHLAFKRGFRYIMFDDNWRPGNPGTDNLSLKTACAAKMGLVATADVVHTDNFGKQKRPLGSSDLEMIANLFDSHITHYMEFPLPWASDDNKYDTLIKNNNADGKYTMENPDIFFTTPTRGYNNVCLVKLNN